MECEPAVPSAISSELPPRSPPTEEESTGAGAEAKQSIVEIMDGEQLHGVPFQPGPQYKRGRGRSFFREAPRRGVVCQVPACERSLHKLRDYYKRYKICPYHLELQCMVVEGQSIRFCQQCGRFQLLDEFDGDRRSCRRKLEKHNERRRRADDGSATESEGEGGRARATRPRPPSHAAPVPAGGGGGEELLLLGVPDTDSVGHVLRSLAAEPLLQRAMPPSMMVGLAGAGPGGGGWAGPPQAQGQAQAPYPPAPAPPSPALMAMFAELAAAQQGGYPPQAPPYAAAPDPYLLPAEQAQAQALHPVAQRHGASPSSALAQLAASHMSSPPPRAATLGAAGGAFAPLPPPPHAAAGGGPAPPPPHLPPATAPNALRPEALQHLMAAIGGDLYSSSGAGVMELLAQLGGAAAAPPLPEDHVTTLSLKLFRSTPDQLPPSLVGELRSWMAKTPTYTEVALRPGCVHIAAGALLGADEAGRLADDLPAAIRRALACTALGAVPGAVLAQLQCAGSPQAAVIADGRLRMVLDLAADEGRLLPRLRALRPLAVTPGYAGAFLLLGPNLEAGGDRIYARAGDAHPAVEVLGGGAEGAECWVALRMPALKAGACQVEAQRGLFVSAPLGFAVLADAAAVAELRQLEGEANDSEVAGVGDVARFAHKAALVARFAADARGGEDADVAARVGVAAQEVAAVCLLRGWPALLRAVLPAVAAACPPADALAAISARLGGGCVLRAAVVRGDAGVVRALGAWAREAGHRWEAAFEAALGMSPLHLAAMLPEPCRVALALNEMLPGCAARWRCPTGPSALSALSVAAALGKKDLLCALAAAGVPAASEALLTMRKHGRPAAAATHAAADDASGSGSSTPNLSRASPSDRDTCSPCSSSSRSGGTDACARTRAASAAHGATLLGGGAWPADSDDEAEEGGAAPARSFSFSPSFTTGLVLCCLVAYQLAAAAPSATGGHHALSWAAAVVGCACLAWGCRLIAGGRPGASRALCVAACAAAVVAQQLPAAGRYRWRLVAGVGAAGAGARTAAATLWLAATALHLHNLSSCRAALLTVNYAASLWLLLAGAGWLGWEAAAGTATRLLVGSICVPMAGLRMMKAGAGAGGRARKRTLA